MNKNRKSKLGVLLLAVLLLAPSSPAALADSGHPAAQAGSPDQLDSIGSVVAKEETIYASLNAGGTVCSVYVVNILDVAVKGVISDYGSYTGVKNLTNLAHLANKDGVSTVAADAGKFYYQGNIAGADLPWVITIRYTLDGQEIPSAGLAGKTGKLGIELQTKQNPAADPSFYKNYLLQVSITLDAGKCVNIAADRAVLANSGKNKLITLTIMPDTTGRLQVSADVTDFEMEGIVLSALPFSTSIDPPDTSGMNGQLALLADAIVQLDAGVADLNAGVRQLSSGAQLLKKGSAEYQAGIAEISGKSKNLIAASRTIGESLHSISASLSSGLDLSGLAALSTLPAAMGSFSTGISDISGGLTELKTGFAAAYAALDHAISAIPDPVAESDLQALYAGNAGNAAFAQLMANYTAAQTVKGVYGAAKPAFASVGSTIDTMVQSLGSITGGMGALSSQLSASLASLDIADALSQLKAGLTALSANYSKFHAGLSAYTDGISKLSSNYLDLNSGLSGLAGGLGDALAGAEALAEGTSELNRQTGNLPGEFESAINKLISTYDHSDFVPISFVSARNTQVTGVQFVLMTDGIKLAEEPALVPETREKSVWDRLVDLFA